MPRKPLKCHENSCETRPTFAPAGSTRGLSCAKHAPKGFVDITNKRCRKHGCKKIPSYALPGTTTCVFCAKHAPKEAVDRRSKKCRFCDKTATFGEPGTKVAVTCAAHKLPGHRNVKARSCGKAGCPTQATFKNSAGTFFCAKHADKECQTVAKKKCAKRGCKTRATFGTNVAQFCASHAAPEHVDVVNKRCVSDFCDTHVATDKYDNYCWHCFRNLYPTDKRVRDHRDTHARVEAKVKKFLLAQFPELGLVHDKPLRTPDCDCPSRRRVDFHTIINGTMFAIEVDEHQYKVADEEARYNDLYMHMATKWVWLRFNPDNYKTVHGNPWTLEARLVYLEKQVKLHVDRIRNEEHCTDRPMEIHLLFYDHFQPV